MRSGRLSKITRLALMALKEPEIEDLRSEILSDVALLPLVKTRRPHSPNGVKKKLLLKTTEILTFTVVLVSGICS